MREERFLTYVPLTAHQAQAVLGAMVLVAGGKHGLAPADERAIAAAAVDVLNVSGGDVRSLPSPGPAELARILSTRELRRYALELIAVPVVANGSLEAKAMELLLQYAQALTVREDEVRKMAESVGEHLAWLEADLSRGAARGRETSRFSAQFLPYDAHPDAELARRYRSLEASAPGTLGRAFYECYSRHGYPFPGEPGALSASFAVPYDSAHLLSAYPVSRPGALLVSMFTAAMHRKEKLPGHILSVVLSRYRALAPDSAARDVEAEQFRRAWQRGAAMRVDTFGPAYDFWNVNHKTLEELRAEYAIAPLDDPHAGR